MEKIRVMIVDDSALMRQIINKCLSKEPEIEVVGSISSAVYALKMIAHLKPDIVTLDIEMPEMDGLTALTELRKEYPKLPVIMCSSITSSGAEATIEALNRGANDYVAKPSSQNNRTESFAQMETELITKVKLFVKKSPQPQSQTNTSGSAELTLAKSLSTGIPRITAIGISTGGPNALKDLLPKLPADYPTPIVIVQHMPALFTSFLAVSLSKTCKVQVKEAEEGDELKAGHVYIAPGDYHMTVVRDKLKYLIHLNQDPKESFCRPAVDVLLRSIAAVFGKNSLVVIMTGMGQDGLLGCKEILAQGGQVVAQDEASSTVWGMPGAVAKAGLAHKICSLQNMDSELKSRVSKSMKTWL
jgi:two-component system chemotaxis response regulator CheB